jgi:hypothetical protein
VDPGPRDDTDAVKDLARDLAGVSSEIAYFKGKANVYLTDPNYRALQHRLEAARDGGSEEAAQRGGRRLNRASRTKEKSMEKKNVLLVGRKGIVLDEVREGLSVQDVSLISATTLDDVRKVLDEHPIDMVIMGAGIDLDTRLQIVRHVFEASDSTTVHMKDRQSGPEGFLPFVKGLLERPV